MSRTFQPDWDREVFLLLWSPTPHLLPITPSPGPSSLGRAILCWSLSLSTLPCPRLSFSLECSPLWEATAAAPDWVEGQRFPVLVAASVSLSVNCARKASRHQGSPQPLTCPRSLSSASEWSALRAAAEGTLDRPQRAARVRVRAAATRAPLFPRPCPAACPLGFALRP